MGERYGTSYNELKYDIILKTSKYVNWGTAAKKIAGLDTEATEAQFKSGAAKLPGH